MTTPTTPTPPAPERKRGPRRNPNSIAKEIHRERLADDAHIRALDRKAAKEHLKGCPARYGGSCFCKGGAA